MAGMKTLLVLAVLQVILSSVLSETGQTSQELKSPPKVEILVPKKIDSCANGNPCDAAFCAKFPSANCRPSAEDPCKAEFFYKNRKVIKECFNDGRCSELCTRHYNPMCGNDGKTYGNECTFNAAKCISKGELRLAKVGECGEMRG